MNRRTLEASIERLERQRKNKPVGLQAPPEWLAAELATGGWEDFATGTPWRYDALPAQREFHRDLVTRFKGYSGPIGSGKSYALAYEALILSQLNPGLLGLIGAPTYTMLQDSTRRTLFEVLDAERIDFVFNKQENRIRFRANGSEIIFRSMENPDRLRGPNLAWFALDELTYTREDAWTRMLGRLRHPEARRLCGYGVWTPKGYDWVYKRFVEKQRPDHRLVQASPKENTHLPENFYELLKDAYAEGFYRQEALGEYLDLYGGNVYHAFGQENIKAVEYDWHLPLCWALDFNVEPLCSVICQVYEEKATHWQPEYTRNVYVNVLDEIVLPQSNTLAAVEEFIRRVDALDTPRPIQVTVYGDASGNQHTTKAPDTDYEILRLAFSRHSRFKINMRQNTVNPYLIDRVNTVNNMLRSISKIRRVHVNPRCVELIKDLRQVAWKRDRHGNRINEFDKSDPDRTHLSDALSYLIAQEFPLKSPIGYR